MKLKEKLHRFINEPFNRLSYTEAIELLKKAQKEGFKFKDNDIKWGKSLESEHERYLTEHVFNGPLFLTDYPKESVAFYMKQNEDGKTVANVDLLVPGIGELCGGSQREEDLAKLEQAMKDRNMNLEAYDWYADLRRYGSVPHAGFGLGFERMIQYVTGMSNIRDVEAYPRSYKECDF